MICKRAQKRLGHTLWLLSIGWTCTNLYIVIMMCCVCMQARQALTGALKIWWDQSQLKTKDKTPDWQPALLPAMFVGAKAAAAAMESSARPIQVSPSLSLILLVLLHPATASQVPLFRCCPGCTFAPLHSSLQLVLGLMPGIRQLSQCWFSWLPAAQQSCGEAHSSALVTAVFFSSLPFSSQSLSSWFLSSCCVV